MSEPLGEGDRVTNNSAEIHAVKRAAKVAKAAGIERLCINTDSDFTIKCMTQVMH